MTRNYKRKPYRIINKSHQYRFLAIILIYNLIFAGILVAVIFLPDFIRIHDQTLSIEVRAVAADNILMLHSRIWPVIFLLISVIGLHSIRMFNRFVGPLYRFTLTFKDVRNGNLENRIQLRKNDFLLQEADVINDMLEVFNEKISDIQKKGQEAVKLLNNFEKEDIKNIDALRQDLDELITSAKYFKTKNNIDLSFY